MRANLANIAEKMVMGRINKYYKEVCLLEQPLHQRWQTLRFPSTRKLRQRIGQARSKLFALSALRKVKAWKERGQFRDEVAGMMK